MTEEQSLVLSAMLGFSQMFDQLDLWPKPTGDHMGRMRKQGLDQASLHSNLKTGSKQKETTNHLLSDSKSSPSPRIGSFRGSVAFSYSDQNLSSELGTESERLLGSLSSSGFLISGSAFS